MSQLLICHQYLLLILALVLCLNLLHFGTASPPVFRSQDVPTKLDIVRMPGFHYNFERVNIRDQSAPDWDTMPLSGRYRNSASNSAVTNFRSSTGTLRYYGGPVLDKMRVIPLFWNNSTKYQTEIMNFYRALPNSNYWKILSQYSNIGNPSVSQSYTFKKNDTFITDSQLQAWIHSLFDSGSLPSPIDGQNYYPIHFPPGVSIKFDGDGSMSCMQFCAYHGTLVRNGFYVQYGVMPDFGQAGCNSGCGSVTVLDNTLSVSSHEIVEAATDPAVGLACCYAPPLSWYNPSKGESADYCYTSSKQILGDGKSYNVQAIWSNRRSACAFIY